MLNDLEHNIAAHQCFESGNLFFETRQKHTKNICDQTNKLILTLDKLISIFEETKDKSVSKDSINQALEKSVVEWKSDELVELCPYCAKSFNFTRRRHHCRTCGSILCNNCSKFLDFKSAYKLVRPTKLYTDRYDRIEDNLLYKDFENIPKIRLCEDCKRLIDKRISSIENHFSQPFFYDFYNKLRRQMAKTDEIMISNFNVLTKQSDFSKQKDSLKELKQKIDLEKSNIDKMAGDLKKMIERETGLKQAHLMQAILQSKSYWSKESLDSKIERIVGRKSIGLNDETFVVGNAWVPIQSIDTSIDLSEEESPLQIQIKILDSFIAQAKALNKYEEVETLEESKRDLEIEYQTQLLRSTNLEEGEEDLNIEPEV